MPAHTLRWLEADPRFGAIGYYGSSYLALTGWAMAGALTPKVKSMFLSHYGADRFAAAYQSGSFRQDVLTAWAMDNAGFKVEADYLESAGYRPQMMVDEALWGIKIPWYRDWISHTNRMDSYWQSGFWRQLHDIPQNVRVPVCLVEGRYDHHLENALNTWKNLSKIAKKHSVLRIGPWNHGFGPCIHGLPVETESGINETKTAFEWFEQTLRNGEMPESRAEYYQIGENKWKTAKEYPFINTENLCFHFSAKKEEAEYGLTIEGTDVYETVGYEYDPANPALSHGAESMLRSNEAIGSLIQPPCGWREDVISFVSEPLQEEARILGPIEVRLKVSSSAEDSAFTAKVMAVSSDGTAQNIRSGIAALAYRGGPDSSRQSYRPGEAVSLSIRLWDIAWTLPKGSRVRVDISSSDFPQYNIHSNFAGVWALQEHVQTARQRIYCGGEDGSKLFLSTKPAEAKS